MLLKFKRFTFTGSDGGQETFCYVNPQYVTCVIERVIEADALSGIFHRMAYIHTEDGAGTGVWDEDRQVAEVINVAQIKLDVWGKE